jgi:hypothetical protein
MRSFSRLSLLLIVAVLALAPVFTVSAQGGDCPPGWSADDCALNAAADAKAEGIMSFRMESWSVSLVVTGAPDGDLNVQVSGDGAIDATSVVPDEANPLSVLDGLTMIMAMEASMAQGASSTSGALEIRIVDGMGYINGVQTTQGTWWGMDLGRILAAAMAAQSDDGGELPIDPSTVAELASNPMIAGLLGGLAQAPGFITGEGADGPTIDGQATRALTTRVNLSALLQFLSSPETSQQLTQMLGQEGAMVMMLVPMFQPILDATTIVGTRYVSPADQMPRGIMFEFATQIDPNLLAGLTGGRPDPNARPISINLMFEVRLAAINQPVTVEAPADATDQTDMILRILESGMDGFGF